MPVRIGTGVSTAIDPLEAATEAAARAAPALGGDPAELAFVFAAGAHLAAPEALLEGVSETLSPRALIGCGAGGVLGDRRELEEGPAVAVWAGALGGPVRPFHATVSAPVPEDGSEIAGLPESRGARAAIVLADPYSFPTEALLDRLAAEAPGMPVLGGLASARGSGGSGVLMLGERVLEEGAVGVLLDGVELLPCVSQGAAPLGPELAITAAEGNIIHELAGRPAVETVQRVVGELSPRERALIAGGLLIGIVVDSGKADYEQGDFLVRGVLGADPQSGALAVAATVRAGQLVRLHARDARSADEDLRRQLSLRMEALAGAAPAGAVIFSCNGRGSTMFGRCDHDATAVSDGLAGAPAAGFFAAGEIGPVGGRSFLHGFTATIAVFPR